jgi:hypothetical protein
MAVSRYDQRKTLEEAEANAIGTVIDQGVRCSGVAPRLLPSKRGWQARWQISVDSQPNRTDALAL